MIKFLLSVSCLLALMQSAVADDEVQAAVDISVQQNGEIWRGQQVTLNLDLKTTGFSFSNTHFNLPEVSGAFLMQTDTTTIKFSETIDSVAWQIIRYPLALYPQRQGQIEIPSIDVRFQSAAGYGSTEKSFAFKTTPLQLPVTSPPGVNPQDLVITTSDFVLQHDWQPQTISAKTGDAVTLTVTRQASDISAMLLPPLPVFQIDGLAAYPQAPAVDDKTNRGDLKGERIDSIIWIVEKPGHYKIPGIRFQWWDPDSHELRQQIIPGQKLEILPSNAEQSETAKADKTNVSAGNFKWPLLFILFVALAGLLWQFISRRSNTQSVESEKSSFDSFQKACKSNDARQTYSALHNWLKWIPPVNTLAEFARICDDPFMRTELGDLQEALISTQSGWHGDPLLKAVNRSRDLIRQQKIIRSKVYLAPLNP